MHRFKLALALFIASAASAQTYQVVLPRCCSVADAAVFSIDTRGGTVRHVYPIELSHPVFAGASTAVTLNSGKLAVLSGASQGSSNITVVSVIDLATGATLNTEISGSLWWIAQNPISGILYAGYYDATDTTHIRELNPSTLAAIRDVAVQAGFPLTPFVVSPDGERIYTSTNSSINAYSALTLDVIGSASVPAAPIGLSADSATLYAYDDNAQAVDAIDTASLTLTQSEPLSAYGIGCCVNPQTAISADGTQLFLGLGSVVLAIDVPAFTGTVLGLPDQNFTYQLSTGGPGAVFLASEATGASHYASLDLATPALTFVGSAPLPGIFYVAGSRSGDTVYALGSSDPAVVLGPAPSTSVLATALAGDISEKGAYDPEDKLLLFPDFAGNVEVVNATKYELQHLIPLNGVGPIFHSNGATYSVVNVSTRSLTEQVELVKFDPVTGATNGRVFLPTNDCGGYPFSVIPEIATSNTHIYVAYFLNPGACRQGGVAVVDAASMALVNYVRFNVFSIDGFTAEPASAVGYLAVTVTPGTHQILKVDFQSGAILAAVTVPNSGYLVLDTNSSTIYCAGSELLAIDASTLAITRSAPIFSNSLALSPDGAYLYAPGAYEVDIVDAASFEVVGVVSMMPANSPEKPLPPIVVSQ